MNLKCLNCEDSLPTSSGLRILYRHVDTIAQKAEGGVCGWRDRASTIDRPRLQMKTYSCTCSCSLPKIQIFFRCSARICGTERDGDTVQSARE